MEPIDVDQAAPPREDAQGPITMAVLKRWLAERDALEKEIAQLTAELEASPAGLRGNLLDAEGFPRADIDIPLIRRSRHRLACLHTDHKVLSKKLEEGMIQLHAATKEAPLQSQSGSIEGPASSSSTSTHVSSRDAAPAAQALRPFARIDTVSPNSPGAEAGFLPGDELLRFGEADAAGGLSAVARTVADRAGTAISVLIASGGARRTLSVTPRSWEGRGLLGVHLVPI